MYRVRVLFIDRDGNRHDFVGVTLADLADILSTGRISLSEPVNVLEMTAEAAG